MDGTDAQGVDRLCLELQERFQWDVRSDRFSVLDRWSSRTSDFYLCRGGAPSAVPVVIKILERERRPDPQGSFEMLQALDAMHREVGTWAVRPPRAFGWSSDPPSIAMEHVPGRDGPSEIRALMACEDRDGLETLARRCGGTLGTWHRRWGVTWVTAPEHDMLRRLSRTAKRQGLGLRSVLPTGTPVRLVFRFRDFGIYNFRRSDLGDLVILDPPPAASRDLDVASRDVAWFLASIANAAVGTPRTSESHEPVSVPRYFAARAMILRAFSEGYEQGAGCELTETDHRLAALIETSYLVARAGGRWRRDPRQAADFARLAWATRRGALHP